MHPKSDYQLFPSNSLESQFPPRLLYAFSSWSVASERHPTCNEDSLISDQRNGLAAVFDGVGGSTAGDVASHLAARVIRNGWKRVLQRSSSKRQEQSALLDVPTTLHALIEEAHKQIRIEGTQRALGQQQPTGTEDQATTVALAVFSSQSGGRSCRVVYAWVGDSRIYLLRAGAGLLCLTRDDSYLSKLVQEQVITAAAAQRIDQAVSPEELTQTELRYFHHRNGITQALGDPQPLDIHIEQTVLEPGDCLLLCTDGVHDNLTNRELEALLRQRTRTPARTIVEQAIQRSCQEASSTMRAKPDDMSAVVFMCQ